MSVAYLQTPLGVTYIEGDADGIREVSILDASPELLTNMIPPELRQAHQQLSEYFRGERNTFDLQLNPQGTDFQKRVWEELLKIPFGRTISYLELARRLGDEKSIRAAAAANGKNPIWLIVPCHRVIGSDGSLTGYAGGLWRKKWLIEYEKGGLQGSLF
ncbi:methylated-DNA--[protein]-cysteine S-methyltransferase [Runella sp. MFBS21]|uniref:methylated-DNA--[protein]-cysteine S-methyltransferase n=1 Tax=Runella sp. MFBS21 TaxID=3034018 RepID=UPI0023F7AADA|nr:methylated-DNA--[protein]-cysteine S-methyltransferase [Runella sp. MFBS21]MDF7820713.1 methylated-DNA--[protein]-cysteine S-methyltransferase [Runella sp. MFBS21]